MVKGPGLLPATSDTKSNRELVLRPLMKLLVSVPELPSQVKTPVPLERITEPRIWPSVSNPAGPWIASSVSAPVDFERLLSVMLEPISVIGSLKVSGAVVMAPLAVLPMVTGAPSPPGPPER